MSKPKSKQFRKIGGKTYSLEYSGYNAAKADRIFLKLKEKGHKPVYKWHRTKKGIVHKVYERWVL